MTIKEKKKLISELDKLDDSKVHHIYVDDILHKILILGRGEMMYFSKKGKSVVIEISARFSKLYLKSLKFWGDGELILENEKKDLILSIKKAYFLAYKEELEIVY